MSRPASIQGKPATEPGLATVAPTPARIAIAALRVVLGFYFLWAFVDKLFGFGFATPAEKAWINGGSPTTGFLSGVKGPFAGVFNTIAGQAWADWLFMAGLLGIGLALILGIGMRVAAVSGVVLVFFMYLASLPLETNPIIDDHVLEGLAIATVALFGGGDVYGLGRWWKSLPLVQHNHWLI